MLFPSFMAKKQHYSSSPNPFSALAYCMASASLTPALFLQTVQPHTPGHIPNSPVEDGRQVQKILDNRWPVKELSQYCVRMEQETTIHDSKQNTQSMLISPLTCPMSAAGILLHLNG